MTNELTFIADIGATNARFAMANRQGQLQQISVLPTPSLGAGDRFYEQVCESLATDQFAGACIGLAGLVEQGRGVITNGKLVLDQALLQSQFGCQLELANDFYALAHGIPSFAQLVQLGGGDAQPGPKALLGAGSGLGMSVLVPQDLDQGLDQWLVLPSEGGYGDLACSNELELAVYQELQQQLDHVSWESVLSGPGLVNLYNALAQLWGQAPQPDVSPQWISAQGVDAQVPLCHQTLDMFFGFLGAAAGNLALTAYAKGGVYIGGGIVPQLQEFALGSSLRRRFEERGKLSGFARQIPLFLVLDDNPGLRGALALWQQRSITGQP